VTEAPLTLYDTRVRPEWLDYNGHMSEAYYVLVFGFATDALLDVLGMDERYRADAGMSLYTLEAHVSYLAEVGEGAPLHVTTQLLGCDYKRVHLFHALHRGAGGTRLATEELLLCNVEVRASRSAPLPAEIAEVVQRLVDAHRPLPVDERVGRAIRLTRGQARASGPQARGSP
jgi:acyl-CoA thioester hydrolase